MAVPTDCLLTVLYSPGGWDLPASSYIVFHVSSIEFQLQCWSSCLELTAAAELTLHFYKGVLLCFQASRPIKQADSEAD